MHTLEASSLGGLEQSVVAICVRHSWFTPEEAEIAAREFVRDRATTIVDPGPQKFSYMLGRYMVRSDDVRLLESGLTSVSAIIAASVGSSARNSTLTVAALLLAAVRIGANVWSDGAPLTELELRVLTVLQLNTSVQKQMGLTLDQLVEVLRRTDPTINTHVVGRVLAGLKQYQVRHMLERQFVSQDEAGVWRSLVEDVA
jgi:hypothetical protein